MKPKLLHHSPAKQDNFAILRHHARRYAVQAMYQWQMTAFSMQTIEGQFLEGHLPARTEVVTDVAYFKQLIYGTYQHCANIDVAIAEFLTRTMQEIDYVELAILRLAGYELLYQLDIPHPIIINEALKLTKEFGSSEGYKFVNGVLDRIAKKCRC